MQDYAKGAQNAGYQNQAGASNSLTQPKELGILQRVEGLRVGLGELRSRLEGFHDRLKGEGSVGEKGEAQTSGLYERLSESENNLRICLAMVSDLDNKF